MKFKLDDEFLKILQDNAFDGTNGDDVVDHTTKFLAILELIKILDIDPKQLRLHVFSLSLTRDARKWWTDEVEGKITTWGELTEKFFHKYYPLSRTCNDRRMDAKTKNALWEFWIKNYEDEISMDDIVSSDEEWMESDNTSHINNNYDSFFKPCLDYQERKYCVDEDERMIYEHNISELDNISICDDEEIILLNEKVCKLEKFDVIRYSLDTNEEYIAISTCELDTWKRTDGIITSIYHELFYKKDQGWL
ncbi:hypothetical protein Tco_0757677, partial [Tanacetum coccineum]